MAIRAVWVQVAVREWRMPREAVPVAMVCSSPSRLPFIRRVCVRHGLDFKRAMRGDAHFANGLSPIFSAMVIVYQFCCGHRDRRDLLPTLEREIKNSLQDYERETIAMVLGLVYFQKLL